MGNKTVYAAEVLNTIAEREGLEQFTGTPIFIHNSTDEELVGWLGCPLPTSGYPCEHMGMGDDGSTACWSATEIDGLREENAKLRELISDMLFDEDWGHNDDDTFFEHKNRASELGIKF